MTESTEKQFNFLLDEYRKACGEKYPPQVRLALTQFFEEQLENNIDTLTTEEQYLFQVVKGARTIQEFLWGEYNGQWNLEEWRRMFRKRIQKIDDIQPDNPHSAIEMKKRLMQNAALCVALLAMIHNGEQPVEGKCDIPSNLPQFSGKCDDPKCLPKSALA